MCYEEAKELKTEAPRSHFTLQNSSLSGSPIRAKLDMMIADLLEIFPDILTKL